jgi:hypothetical protein
VAVREPQGRPCAALRRCSVDHRPFEARASPQQVHLDLLVDGHEEAAQRAVALGDTRLAESATWITLADPAGHPFGLSTVRSSTPVRARETGW